MKIHEVRALSTEAIEAQLNDTREELMKLRFQLSSGELTDFTRLRHNTSHYRPPYLCIE